MTQETIWGSTEFIAAIVGAVVGGLISFVVQIVALVAAKWQRDEDRLEVRRALAHSLIFKIMRMCSNFHGLHDHIEMSLKHTDSEVAGWQVVTPIANLPPQRQL
jgi:hypothetical protein